MKGRLLAGCWVASLATTHAPGALSLDLLGTFATGTYGRSAAEIVAYDPASRRVFVTNAADARVDALDVANPAKPSRLFSIDVEPYGKSPNSVAVKNGLVAVAIEGKDRQGDGAVAFFDVDGRFIASVGAGALPDMLAFTPDGAHVLVANEGEPNADYTIDPVGSVSVIDVRNPEAPVASKVALGGSVADACKACRVFGPGSTAEQDLEPEYIAISSDSRRAWVTCQENNAIATVDVASATLLALTPLGRKLHAEPRNAFDASDRAPSVAIRPWPVEGLYSPDAIVAFDGGGSTYLLTANEGDPRDYPGFSEEARVGTLKLDPTAFPDAASLQADTGLGRLRVSTIEGDIDRDGDFDELHAFGARSFAIWDAEGKLLYESGDELEEITSAALEGFNANGDDNRSFKGRCDDRGPEPEGAVVGVVDGRRVAFIGLERIGGVVVYDIDDPTAPEFVEYVNTRDFSGKPEAGTAGDLSPEGLVFVPAGESPTGRPLLVVGYEVSGTVSIYDVGAVGSGAPRSRPGLTVESKGEGATVRYEVPQASDVTVRVVRSGKELATLARGEHAAGSFVVSWQPADEPSKAEPCYVALESRGWLAVRRVPLGR